MIQWFMVGLLSLGLVGCASSTQGPPSQSAAPAEQRSAMPRQSKEWLARLNAYRQTAGLSAIKEDSPLSNGDFKHSRYLVKNQMVDPGLGARMHDEDPDNPWYTPEGRQAGQTSDVIPPSRAGLSDDEAIDGWLSAPFHALPMLDPDLQQAGYGSFCENGLCAATLNVGRDERWARDAARRRLHFDPERQAHDNPNVYFVAPPERRFPTPIEFPPDGFTITKSRFEGNEWPNPLAACPGYTPPTGFPVVVSFGSSFVPEVTDHSIKRDSEALEHCLVSADTYSNTDESQQRAARDSLRLYGAVFLIARDPFVPGSTYTVSVARDRQVYSWSFKVASKEPLVAK
ncbi:MAG: CAP domain-containing protein [Candidatus Binataceae bacterium]